MRLPGRRVQGRLLQRLNRFVALVELEDGQCKPHELGRWAIAC
ncbi:MAG TPA: hypothetical protein VI789_03785 [Dehalococcoidia bacterium]|nr:hypothetical protein [Dehalococcoidia bacterium]